jgi:hypothetical protein
MPQDHQGQATEPMKSAMDQGRRPWPARVPSWLVECLRLGSGMPALAGQIPPPWAWWENEAPATRAACSSAQAAALVANSLLRNLQRYAAIVIGPAWPSWLLAVGGRGERCGYPGSVGGISVPRRVSAVCRTTWPPTAASGPGAGNIHDGNPGKPPATGREVSRISGGFGMSRAFGARGSMEAPGAGGAPDRRAGGSLRSVHRSAVPGRRSFRCMV